jgi:hypothetical protein
MRKQVQLDLGTPALRPTSARGGQYSVAVAPTPKTNSALQLAQALRRVPQVLGQASNIAKDLGAEAALSTMDVEAAMQDKESKGILGYNKAYQQGLVKRHFAMNEEIFRERFQNVAGRTNLPTGATDEERMASINEFVSNLDKERDMFNQELRDMFGGDTHREQALQALSSVFVDGIYDDSMKIYKENLEQQTEMFISADASTMMKSKGVASGLDYAINEYKALGISPKERSIKLRGIVTADAAVLIEQGKVSQAEALLNAASSYSLHGNAKLFGSAAGKKEITTVRRSIRSAREASEVSFLDNSKGLGRSVDALLEDVADPDVSLEDRQASALRMAKRAGASDEEAQTFAEVASAGGIDAMMDAYRDLTRNAENENMRDLLNDQLKMIRNARDDHFGGSASTIGTFTPEDMGTLEADIRTVMDRNPNTARTYLPVSVNGRKVNVQDPDYIEMMRRIKVDYEWATVPSQKGSIIREAQKFIRSKDSRFGTYAGEYAIALQSDLDAVAPSLYRQAKGDIAVYEGLLSDKADELKAQYKRRADLRGDTESLLEVNLPPSKEKQALEEAGDNRIVGDLKSFSGEGVTAAELSSDREALKALETTKRGLTKSEKKRLLQASLLDYGFPTMDSIDLEMLSDADMGFSDVLLGDNVLRSMIPALRGLSVSEDERTPEQKKAIKTWEAYGFDSVEDYYKLEEAQETLRNLANR